MAVYLGKSKVSVTGIVKIPRPMKDLFNSGIKFGNSSVTSFDGIFQYEDTSDVTDMDNMFYSCGNLKTILLFDTSNVVTMQQMFYYCVDLTSVPRFDVSNVMYMGFMFSGCENLEAIHMININSNLNISSSTKFTREALLEIIGNLKAQASGNKTLTMGSTNLAKLTDEDKAIATNKGWTLA